jgi:PE family
MTADFDPVPGAVLAVCNQPAPQYFSRRSAPRACVVVVRPNSKEKPMSFVSIVPELLSTAAENLQSVGVRLQAQNTAAAAPTTALIPPASDEVSALTAMQFAAHAYAYQAVSAQASAIHQMFVTMLSAGADSYATTEAANAVATG